jgi:hypothetical protein
MVLAPLDSEGTVMLPDNVPVALTDSVFVAATPPNVTEVTDSEANHPEPVIKIELLTAPLVGEKLAA